MTFSFTAFGLFLSLAFAFVETAVSLLTYMELETGPRPVAFHLPNAVTLNTVPHVIVGTPTIRSFLLVLCSCDFVTVRLIL